MNNKILTVTLNPCIDKTIILSDFKKGEVNRADDTLINAGGKGINVSRFLSACDISSTALGFSGGSTGDLLEKFLNDENVSCDFTKTNCQTRTNYKIYDAKNLDTTDINEKGKELSNDDYSNFFDKLSKYLDDAEVIALSGSVPENCDKNIYAKITNTAKGKNLKVVVDAEGDLLKNALSELPYAIKPNKAELSKLFAKEFETIDEIISAMRILSDKGIELVVVSLGKDGALFLKNDEIIRSYPLPVHAKSAVGCGDSMVGAICHSIIHNHNLETLAKLATAAGSLTASLDGTKICKTEDAEAVMCDVKIEKMN